MGHGKKFLSYSKKSDHPSDNRWMMFYILTIGIYYIIELIILLSLN